MRIARIAERFYFGVRRAGSVMVPFADHVPVAHNNRTDGRIRRGAAFAAFRQLVCPIQEDAILRHDHGVSATAISSRHHAARSPNRGGTIFQRCTRRHHVVEQNDFAAV